MLGLDTSWYIGSPATARPLAKEPFTPPKRRLRLVRKTASFTFGGEAARACLDLAVLKRRANASRAAAASSTRPCGAGGSTNARKAGGGASAAQTGISPDERQPARKTSGRGARARKQP